MDELNNSKASSKTNNISNNTADLYIFFDYIEMDLSDPISCLYLNNKFIVIGTFNGRLSLIYLNTEFQKEAIIFNKHEEHISGISYIENPNKLYVSVGDESIHCIGQKDSDLFYPIDIIQIHESLNTHLNNCDYTYVMMSTKSLLKLTLINPYNEAINETEKQNLKYEVINFNNKENTNSRFTGEIKTTNYYIPLDFDGLNFCWLEYLDNKQDRNLCVQTLLSQQTIIENVEHKFQIDKNYGHISYAKLLNGSKILIVHDLNKCEIRDIANDFDLLESFTHIGDEIYALDIFYIDKIIFGVEKNNDNDIKEKKRNNKNLVIESYDCNNENIYKPFPGIKINGTNKLKLPKIENKNNNKMFYSLELKTDSNNLLQVKENKKKNNVIDNKKIVIITLDIDGNINKYENHVEETLFNLYDIKGIDKDQQDKKFFNMGFIYYIKTDLNYFCISTDFGCYIIKRND